MPLNWGKKYDKDFVANFMKNTTVEKFKNRPTFVNEFVNECIVAHFFG